MIRLKSSLLKLTARGDVAMAMLLGVVVFLMILPMPTPLVDFFIAVNIAAAVTLLMVGIYITSPLKFSALPSVLLLSTLFRLAISITTTRLILLQADAGDIVYSFGNFVVAGNIVVGVVVFLIITIVQFIVITKGSERVAEVSARFSLDGMPGKQMSIDADLRAGIIDSATAFERRTRLERQSQMYGSMDGAMKFVKGDAIAGLCIIVVNIIGGISIGVLQQGLPIGDALRIYTTLTIGDGLVAQIPALLIAITAGIIVTRVTEADDDDDNLGASIAKQLFAHPNALLVAAIASIGFAGVPGFPTLTFLFLGTSLGAVGWWLKSSAHRQSEVDALTSAVADADFLNGDESPLEKIDDGVIRTLPLALWLSRDNETQPGVQRLNDEFAIIRKRLMEQLGVVIPGVQMRYTDALPPHRYTITLREIPVAKGHWCPGHVCVPDAGQLLGLLGIEPQTENRNESQVTDGDELTWVNAVHSGRLAELGMQSLDIESVIAMHLSQTLRAHAAEFIGLQETRSLLNRLESEFPDLVKEVLSLVPLQRITQVMKRLLEEEISIRDLHGVLEALVYCGQSEKDPMLLVECVRAHLKRQISYHFSDASNVMPVVLLDAAAEETLRAGIRQTPQGSFIALDTDVRRQFLSKLRHVASRASRGRTPIIVTCFELRRYLRRLLETENCPLPVLAFAELIPEVVVQPLESIKLDPVKAG